MAEANNIFGSKDSTGPKTHVIKMSLGGACQTSLGPHIFTIAPD